MCYYNFGNGVCYGAFSITYWCFLNDFYKLNPMDQLGKKKILVNKMGFLLT